MRHACPPTVGRLPQCQGNPTICRHSRVTRRWDAPFGRARRSCCGARLAPAIGVGQRQQGEYVRWWQGPGWPGGSAAAG